MIRLLASISTIFTGICICILTFSFLAAEKANAHSPQAERSQLLASSNLPVADASGGMPTIARATNMARTMEKIVDTTAVHDANTAGTVRVNNLAAVEAMLNVVANGAEVLGILWGGYLALSALIGKKPEPLPATDNQFMPYEKKKDASRQAKKLFLGLFLIVGGMAVPGTINWLVASARDANLCN